MRLSWTGTTAGLAMLGLGACAGLNGPSWLTTGGDTRYPTSQYVTGVGCGPTARVAELLARGDVAEKLNSTVTSNTTVWTGESAGPQGVTDKRAIGNMVSALSSVRLPDVTYPLGYRKDTGEVCVLAAVNRAQAKTSLQLEIGKINTILAKLHTMPRSNKLKKLRRDLNIILDYRLKNLDKHTIGLLTDTPVTPNPVPSYITKAAEELRGLIHYRVTVLPNAEGEYFRGSYPQAIRSVFSTVGFSESTENADWIIEGHFTNYSQNGPTVYAEGSTYIRDADTNAVLLRIPFTATVNTDPRLEYGASSQQLLVQGLQQYVGEPALRTFLNTGQ